MQQRRSKILDLVLRHGHDVLWESTGRLDTCILATAVGLRVLPKFGIDDARELSVEALAANGPAMTAFAAGIEIWSAVEHACAVYMGDQPPDPSVALEGHWCGHVVIVAGETLLDLTADQASRTAFDLTIGPVRMELGSSFFSSGEYQIHQPAGVGTSAIAYRPASLHTGYASTQLWADVQSQERLALEIIKRVAHDLRRDEERRSGNA